MRARTLCQIPRCCILASAALGVAGPLSAQSGELRLGDVARVSATTPAVRGLVGRVVALTDDTLTLQTDAPPARVVIAKARVTSTERQLPNASRADAEGDSFRACLVAAIVRGFRCGAHSSV